MREFRHFKRSLVLGNVFAIIQALSLIPISLFFKRIIDTYIPNGDAVSILWVLFLGLGLWGIHMIAAVLSRYYTLSATKRVTEGLRARLTMKIQQMTLKVHDNQKAADLHSRVILDTERVDIMANALVVHVLVSIIVIVAAAALLTYINARLFLLLFLMLPFYFIIRSAFAPKLKEGHRNFRAEMEKMSSIVSEVIHSIRLVKSFAMEHHEQRRVEERIQKVTHRGVRLFTEAAAFQILLQFVGGMAMLAIFTVGGWMVINRQISVGDVVAFATLTGYFLNPINTLIATTDQVYAGTAALESIYGLFDMYDTEESDHLPGIDVRGQVEFDGASFEYQPGHPVLRDISLVARPGQQVALVGGSGAGKTTLINLILGFYRPVKGRVLIDGQDVAATNLQSLREQIGVVSQDNVLLSGTIRNNILYGKLDATDEEISAAATAANAHDFISALPDGYDSEIGDRGVKLSGGQKQRIAIARAILKNPRILILDEATSALDSESEHAVQEALDRLRRNRTSFIIAHRLSTVQSADEIIVLENGRIVERGTFDELVARKGEFYRFYMLQFSRQSQGAA
ncbi:MAG: ABC transporter ATP-binding protein/permease [Candidatus Sumerlaeaceae bacterium]|nr:ABC transporter ATP-binding protein/permease [Candidatus Sumerlaeaceae bacterium]